MFNLKRTSRPTGSLYNKGVYPAEFNDTFKAYIRQRDGYECALCPTKGDNLDVHHINYTKYTVKANCISLCRECHTIVHAIPEGWYRAMFGRHLYQIILIRENLHTTEDIRRAWSEKCT